MEDYEATYEERWKEIVENPDGSLNKDQVMRELHDYDGLMRRAAEVYIAVTGNRCSKPEYLAGSVISVYEEHVEGLIAAAVAEQASVQET